jgi:hypothetical protein
MGEGRPSLCIHGVKFLSYMDPVSDAKLDRVYCARALLDILEEPAQLRPMVAEQIRTILTG